MVVCSLNKRSKQFDHGDGDEEQIMNTGENQHSVSTHDQMHCAVC